jgi:hypothetical protein
MLEPSSISPALLSLSLKASEGVTNDADAERLNLTYDATSVSCLLIACASFTASCVTKDRGAFLTQLKKLETQGEKAAATRSIHPNAHGFATAKKSCLVGDSGCCGGKGGSMHLSDQAAGFIAATPIVGSTVPIAVGAALTAQREGKGRVVAVFLGDGAMEAGVVHESLNFATLKNLSILFVCMQTLLLLFFFIIYYYNSSLYHYYYIYYFSSKVNIGTIFFEEGGLVDILD